jgi:hypothetical protein
MAKITFTPIEELVIHEYVNMGADDLLRERVTPAGSMPLYWCDGMLFSFSSLPWTRDIVKDYMTGKIHWAEVHYTRMEKYRPVLDLNDENYKAQIKVRVIDTSSSGLHKEFTKWLKARRNY